MRQVVLDTETTGLSPKQGHRMIEVGCLELVNRRLTGEKLHHYINPERDIESGAAAVHGITQQFLQDKPTFRDIADELLNFLKGAELIIHNAPFDVGFLNHEFKQLAGSYQLITEHCAIIDTLIIARKKHPGQQVSLDALCRRYKVNNANRELHGALLDSELLAQVYLLMTGGQASFLFDKETDLCASQISLPQAAAANKRKASRVVHANALELEAHQAFLQYIQHKDG